MSPRITKKITKKARLKNEQKVREIENTNRLSIRGSKSASVGVRSTLAAACAYSILSGFTPVSAQETNTEPSSITSPEMLPPVVVKDKRLGIESPYAEPGAPYKVNDSANRMVTEPIAETPKSITVIPKEVIQDTKAQTFKEAMRNQPGITLGTGEGGNAFGDRIFIRGFDARNDVYIDGLRDPGVVQREIFSVEQIEVMKGPSSGFAGRGTTGGAVNIVTKAPAPEDFNKGEVTIGTDATKRVTLDTNHNITEEVGIRLNVMGHDAEVAERDVVENKRWGAAIAGHGQVSESVGLDFDYYHLNTDDVPDWGVPFDSRTQQPFEDQDRRIFYGIKDRDFWETQTDVATIKGTVDINDKVSAQSRFRFGRTSNEYVVSAPERPDFSDPNPQNWTVQSSPKNLNATNEYYINQTDVRSEFETGPIGHTLTTGVQVSRERIQNNPFSGLDSESGSFTSIGAVEQSALSPNPYQPWNTPIVASGNIRETTVDTVAAYLLDTLSLTESLNLSGGLRLDNYYIKQTQSGLDREGMAVPNQTYDDLLVNFQTGLVYKIVPQGNVYVAYSSSSNPTGEQLDGAGVSYGGISPETKNLDPERNFLYEVGTKWELFNRRVLATAALFQIDKENARVASGPNGSQVVTLNGEQRVQGFELGLGGNISPEWSVFSGFTYLDTEITKSDKPEEVGQEFPNIADTSLSFLTKYAITPKIEVGGMAYYQSSISGGSTAAGSPNLPSYWKFDLLSEYDVTEDVEISFNIKNLLNERYYDSIYRSSSPFAYVAPGRAAYVTVGVKF